MYKSQPIPGFISDNELEFAEKAIETYLDIEKWSRFQSNGFTIINQNFDKEKLERVFINKLNELLINLEHHRKENFTGAMLKHQTMNSTKYLSKWIEEKNK
jgi:hypothetical protein